MPPYVIPDRLPRRPWLRQLSLVLAVSCLALLGCQGGRSLGDDPTSRSDTEAQTLQGSAFAQSFAEPPLSARPKWWWSPGEVSTEEVAREVHAMADAGFSGAVAGLAEPSQHQLDMLSAALLAGAERNFTVDQFMGQGWPISTPNAGGDASSQNHQRELIYGVLNILGPLPYVGPVPLPRGWPQPGSQIEASPLTQQPTLHAVVAAKVLSEGVPVIYPAPGVLYQPYALDQPIAPTAPGIPTILDTDSLKDISTQVDENGILSFSPPDAGHWVVFGFYERPTFEAVMNHLSRDAVEAVGMYLDEHQIGAQNRGLIQPGSKFMEDSLELVFSGIPWTQNMPETFKQLWGYDMTPFLPLLYIQNQYQAPGYDPEHMPNPDYDLPEGLGNRVRYDYNKTLDHLYIHEHLLPFQAWASSRGAHFASQVAYGAPFDQIRSSRALNSAGGVAEVEARNAGDPVGRSSRSWHFAFDMYRATASGAHQAGKNRVASEVAANNTRGFLMSLSEYKALMDKQWAAGVSSPNVVLFIASAPGDPWPSPNGAGGIVLAQAWNDQHYPEWAHWKQMTDYWARGTHVLESGQAQVDVLIYRDAATTFASTAGAIALDAIHNLVDPQLPFPLFTDAEGGHPIADATRLASPNPFFDTQPLESKGYTVEYTDPTGLTDPRASGNGNLYPAGPSYQALVIDERSMPGDAALALAQEVDKGLAVVIVGTPPSKGKRLLDPVTEDAQVQAAFARILGSPRTRIVDSTAEVAQALAQIGIRPRLEFDRDTEVYSQARRIGSDDVWYLWNAGSTTAEFNASFATTGMPQKLDLWTGETTFPALYRVQGDRVELPLQLRPGETLVLAFDHKRPAAEQAHVITTTAKSVLRQGQALLLRDDAGGRLSAELSDGRTIALTVPPAAEPISADAWSLQVHTSEPTPRQLQLDEVELRDWRDIPELREVSGTGIYTSVLNLPASWKADGRSSQLDLGEFFGTVAISINGSPVPAPATSDTAYTLPLPALPRVTRRIDVSDYLQVGANTLEVVLSTTIQNAAKAQLSQGSTASPSNSLGPSQPYGLIGPVRLVPYIEATVQ